MSARGEEREMVSQKTNIPNGHTTNKKINSNYESILTSCDAKETKREIAKTIPQLATAVAPNEKRPPLSANVVVIGAGLAGLAAAQRLCERSRGTCKVVVLEAQNRIGGRVHTVQHEGAMLELGAQWLHGAHQNPLYKWLSGNDHCGNQSLLDDFEDASLAFEGLFCTNQGELVERQLVEKVLQIVNKSKTILLGNGYKSIVQERAFKNAGQVFRYELDLQLEANAELRRNRRLVEAIFEWFLRYETIENCCDTMDEVSISSYTNWTDWGEGTLLNFKHGYSSLLELLSGPPLKPESVYLNKQVVGVEMLQFDQNCEDGGFHKSNSPSKVDGTSYGGPMLVRYVQGQEDLKEATRGVNCEGETNCNLSTRQEVIECSHVLVTCSLGFLKKHVNSCFFEPPLSPQRSRLIESIGFGTVNKIVLQFERPFWLPEHGIKLLWPCCDDSLKELSRVPITKTNGIVSQAKKNQDTNEDNDEQPPPLPVWVRDIVAFDVVRKQPNLLIGWIGGQGARQMESETDEQVGRVCHQLLKAFLTNSGSQSWPSAARLCEEANESKLVACTCSRWNSNPFICGSYSFQSIESFDLDVDKLHEPVYSIESASRQSQFAKANTLQQQSVSRDGDTRPPDSSLDNAKTACKVPRILFAGEATAGKLYSTTHGAVITGWREADRLVDHLEPATQPQAGDKIKAPHLVTALVTC